MILGVYLSPQDTSLKYIGCLHSYFIHTIRMFNPASLGVACIQETHLEERGKNIPQESNKNPFKGGDKGKGKFKGKGKKNAFIEKEGEQLTCNHFLKDGYDEDHCWKLHPEMRPKNFSNK